MLIKAGVEGQEVLHLTTVEALTIVENIADQLKKQQTEITINLFNYDSNTEQTSGSDNTGVDDVNTEPKKSDIWIRNFGNDTRCRTRRELKKVLATKYKALSVSVRFESSTGARRVIYVDVDVYGIIRDSAKQHEIVDFDELFDTQL